MNETKNLVNAAAARMYIIGSISADGKSISFSTSPAVHATHDEAVAEVNRLTSNNPGKRYVPAKLMGSAIAGGIRWD